jgi:hypothetical protein
MQNLSLDTILAAFTSDMEGAGLDATSLPVFGGEEPSAAAVRAAGYQAAWSWDATRVLVTDRSGRPIIVDRADIG